MLKELILGLGLVNHIANLKEYSMVWRQISNSSESIFHFWFKLVLPTSKMEL